MKTLLSGVLGVAIGLAGVAGWATLGRADSKTPRMSVSLSAAVSFTKTAHVPAAAEAARAREQLDQLNDYQVSPPAIVDPSSIRKVGPSTFMAVRNDGSVCLSQRSTLGCYVGFEAGGISTSVGDGRTYDSPDAPFRVVIDGIARDGVKRVVFELNDGSTATAAVIDNAFEVTIPNHLANDLVAYRVESATGAARHIYPTGHFPAPDSPLKIIGR